MEPLTISSPMPVTAPMPAPYSSNHDYVVDRLEALKQRVRMVAGALPADAAAATCAAQEALRALEQVIWQRTTATATERVPFQRLVTQLSLTPSEELVLWVLIAQDLCSETRRLIRQLDGEHSMDPSTDVLRRLAYGASFDPVAWRELSPLGALQRFRLIERAEQMRDAPAHRQAWRVSTRVLALVHGEWTLDPSLSAIAREPASTHPTLADLELPEGFDDRFRVALTSELPIIVWGGPATGRCSALVAALAARGQRCLIVDARSLSKERELAESQLRSVARECRLFDLRPIVCDVDVLLEREDDAMKLLEQTFECPLLATSRTSSASGWKRSPVTIHLPPLLATQRVRVWSRALPMAFPEDTQLLAELYPLAPGLIATAGRVAIERAGGEQMEPRHIQEGVRAVLDDRFAGLARRIDVTQTWDDLVLPDDQARAAEEILARVQGRGRVLEQWGFAAKVGRGVGVCALLSGPPGTGKTMTAGLIARALHTELYQVDLSKIVSKFIGETEKNLAALFDAAETSQAVLLFDEADALFGKRTDVKSSNDRHANQEVNYLLQRLDAFTGVVLLTTNHEQSLDAAFRRRLTAHIKFEVPSVEERAALWRAMLPAAAPVGDIDFDALASSYVMAGGHIKNAVLRAAFTAARDDASIDTPRLAAAAQAEYDAMGKLASFA